MLQIAKAWLNINMNSINQATEDISYFNQGSRIRVFRSDPEMLGPDNPERLDLALVLGWTHIF